MRALKQKEINYYKIFNQKPELSDKRKKYISMIAPIAAITFLGAVVLSVQLNQINSVKKQVSAEKAYLNDRTNTAKYEEYNKLYLQVAEINVITEDMRAAVAAINSFPQIRSEIFGSIYAYAGKTISISSIQYDENSAKILITGSSKDVFDASSFAASLERIEAFYSIDYTGYQSGNDNRYFFTMECTVNGTEIIPEEAE
ncbi:MAG: hypothetical protein RRZ42_04715 [Oscillospiraceae bacterium]